MGEPKKGEDLINALLFSILAQSGAKKYTDQQIETIKALGPFTYEGDVSTYADLPTLTAEDKGKVYGVEEDGSEQLWTGVAWRDFGADLTLILQDIADLKRDKYELPEGGIPKTDLSQDVQDSLNNNMQSDVVAQNYADLTFPIGIGKLCIHQGHFYRATQDIPTTEDFTPAHWEKTSVEEEFLKQVYLTVTLIDSDGIQPSGITVTVTDPGTGAEIFTEEYDGQPVTFKIPQGTLYTITPSGFWREHLDPSPAFVTGVATQNASITFLYTVVTGMKFGVSGVGGLSRDLTRLWDSVGLTATPSTDTVEGSSGFDQFVPFNRKRVVGSWSVSGGKAVFEPQAYYGDADYAEDGSMGDYVAIDVTPFFYIEADGTIGVSARQHAGWSPHPVCLDADGNFREHTYLPCYPLALKDGHAVSLPGYYNEAGDYIGLWNKTKTYGDGSLSGFTTLEPSVVDHYNWLLVTIEYATQDIQQYIKGTGSLSDSTKTIRAVPEANKMVFTASDISQWDVGACCYVNSDSNKNTITSIVKCDESGTPTESGTYKLVTYDGVDRSSLITAGTTKAGIRPWRTGCCNGVLGHTGSPVSNTDGLHPCRYRWVENPWANQNMTAADLMDVRVDEGGSKYHLDWYYCNDLAAWIAAGVKNPDVADLVPAKGWVKLGVTTDSDHYVSGYIKELSADPNYPTIRVPTNTSGGSDTTYYCDYAYLVISYVVRAVRRRGNLSNGAYSGPCYVSAYYAPSISYWSYGGGLFFIQ